jgi:ribonuclease P protein component
MSSSKVWTTPHFVVHQWRSEALAQTKDIRQSSLPIELTQELRLGAMTPKRWAKRAVTRNLIKRQIFNVSEQFAHLLPATAYVVRLRSSFDPRRFISASSEELKLAVRQELTQLFIKLTAS